MCYIDMKGKGAKPLNLYVDDQEIVVYKLQSYHNAKVVLTGSWESSVFLNLQSFLTKDIKVKDLSK